MLRVVVNWGFMKFKVAVVQLNSSSNMDENIKTISDLVVQAKEQRANLVCLPEHCLMMPKSSRDMRLNADYMNAHSGVKAMQRLAEDLSIEIIIGSVAVFVMDTNKLKNRSIYISSEGEILAYYDKMHLFNTVINGRAYNESRSFAAGDKLKVYWTKFGKLGMSICYDIRFPYLFRKMAQKGAEFVSIPAAFTEETGRLHWHALARARAIENGVYVFAPAQCGQHDNRRKTFGHSLIVDPFGEIVAEMGGDKPGVIFAEIATEKVMEARKLTNSLGVDKLPAKTSVAQKKSKLLRFFKKND